MASGKFNPVENKAHEAGGIGGAAPDVAAQRRNTGGARSGAANYAGGSADNARLASCPEKPLCGQLQSGYYLVCPGKSFQRIMSVPNCTSYEVNPKPKLAGHVVQSRVEQGRKLRAMYRSLGWSRADCAKFLHVTERCLHNWKVWASHHPVRRRRLGAAQGSSAVTSPLPARSLFLL